MQCYPTEKQIGCVTGNSLLIYDTRDLSVIRELNFGFSVRFFSQIIDGWKIIVVSSDAPSQILVWSINESKSIGTVNFDSPITSFRSFDNFLAVSTENCIHVVKINPLQLMSTVSVSQPSTHYLHTMKFDESHCTMAYSDGSIPGTVYIVRIPTYEPPIVFKAHESNIKHVTISPNGTMVLTASEKGTIIRVWNTIGKLLCESRRGFMTASIEHLSFSPCSKYFVSTSDHSTVHVFSVIPSDGYLLPKSLWRYNIEEEKLKASYFIGSYQQILTVSKDGTVYIYNLDQHTGSFTLVSKMALKKITQMIRPNQ